MPSPSVGHSINWSLEAQLPFEITDIPKLIAYADDIPTIDDLNGIEISFSESLFGDDGWSSQGDGFKRQVLFSNFSVAWLEFRLDTRELVVFGDSPRLNISVTEVAF